MASRKKSNPRSSAGFAILLAPPGLDKGWKEDEAWKLEFKAVLGLSEI